MFIHTIGIARATAKIGMANIAFNMKRLAFRDRRVPVALVSQAKPTIGGPEL